MDEERTLLLRKDTFRHVLLLVIPEILQADHFLIKSWFYLGFPIIAPMVLLNVCEDKTSVVHAGFFDGKSADSKIAGKTKQRSFSILDTLYEKGQWTKLYDSSKALYEAENDKDPEIVWRFARAIYEMSKVPRGPKRY